MKKVTTTKPVTVPAEPTRDPELAEVLKRLAELQSKPSPSPVVNVHPNPGPLIVEIERDADGRMKRLVIERGTKH